MLVSKFAPKMQDIFNQSTPTDQDQEENLVYFHQFLLHANTRFLQSRLISSNEYIFSSTGPWRSGWQFWQRKGRVY